MAGKCIARHVLMVCHSDTESDPLTAVLDADVANGTLALSADGSFDYTPDNGLHAWIHLTILRTTAR